MPPPDVDSELEFDPLDELELDPDSVPDSVSDVAVLWVMVAPSIITSMLKSAFSGSSTTSPDEVNAASTPD